MINYNTLNYMVELANVSADDVVLEVGAGLGHLTELLSQKAQKVYAIELDKRLYHYLANKFRDVKNVSLILGDVLKINLPRFNKVVSNLPFSISTEFTIKLLTNPKGFHLAVLTYQREVALRMVATPGSQDYGRLSVVTQLLSDVQVAMGVPRSSFYPPPEVDAAIVVLKPKPHPLQAKELSEFANFVALLFSQRRKLVEKAVSVVFHKILKLRVNEEQVSKALVSLRGKRVFELTPEELLLLYKDLKEEFLGEGYQVP